MPADRLFGQVEKRMKRVKDILTADEYYFFYSIVGLVRKLGDNWKVRDFKAFKQYMNSIDGIKEAERVKIRKVAPFEIRFKLEGNYFHSDKSHKFKNVMKGKNKLAHSLLPIEVEGQIFGNN